MRKSLLVLIPLLTISLTSPALAGTSQLPIINGEQIDDDVFPSAGALIVVASMIGTDIVMPMCTATLIAPDVVMTAGHCVDEYPLTYGLFPLDSHSFCVSFESDLAWMTAQGNTDLPDDAACSSGFVAHQDFDIQGMDGSVDGMAEYDDIALVFLEEPVTDRAHAWLPTEEEAEAIVEQLVVDIVGYGQRDAAPMDPFGAPPEPLRFWGESFVNEVADYELQIGGDASTTRKCHGDSGGPSYAQIGFGPETERVIGVTSHAYSAAEDCNIGGVDTRVDHYLDWIDEEMRNACDAGLRTECDEPGILEPPAGEGDDDDAVDDDDDDDGGAGGQDGQADMGGAGSSGLVIALALGLLAVLRRRA